MGHAHAAGIPINNRGITFYLFWPDQRDTIPFLSSQKYASSNREA